MPNLASRVLGLSLRRLPADMQAAHGYPALLAETFVDVSRFAGTCYRAANWRSLGLTRGFAREPGGAARRRHHGQPKEVFVFELTDGAPEALSQTEMPANWATKQHTEPTAAPRLRSLFECLSEVPEYRHARGKRYALNTILTLAVAARLAGYRGVNAFAQFAALLSQEQLKAVGAVWSPSRQCYTPPAITTFHNVLAALTPETLDNAIGQWNGQHNSAHAPVAMDGKDLRGASEQTEDGRRMMVAAVEHDTGVVLGQVEVDAKSNEIPAVRELSGDLDLTGRIVTMDAMHTQHETARCLLGRRADYVVSAVKDNQETILEDLKAIDFSDAPSHETVDKGHGRIKRRHCAVVDLSAAEWDGYANLRYTRRKAYDDADQRAGAYVLRISHTDWDIEQVLRTYWRITDIEATFRSLKSELGLRPIHHQLDRRVAAHLMIAVFAYHAVQLIRTRLAARGIDKCWTSIRESTRTWVRITTRLTRTDGTLIVNRQDTRPAAEVAEMAMAAGVTPALHRERIAIPR